MPPRCRHFPSKGALLEQEQKDLLLNSSQPAAAGRPGRERFVAEPRSSHLGRTAHSRRTEDHVSIAGRLDLVDFERSARMSGSGFACFKGKGARLERALINFLLDLHTKDHGYTEVSPPFLIRPEVLGGHLKPPQVRGATLSHRTGFALPCSHRRGAADQSPPRRGPAFLVTSSKIRCLYSLLPAGSRRSRSWNPRAHPHAPVRQS